MAKALEKTLFFGIDRASLKTDLTFSFFPIFLILPSHICFFPPKKVAQVLNNNSFSR